MYISKIIMIVILGLSFWMHAGQCGSKGLINASDENSQRALFIVGYTMKNAEGRSVHRVIETFEPDGYVKIETISSGAVWFYNPVTGDLTYQTATERAQQNTK